jgi:hypothetical protein
MKPVYQTRFGPDGNCFAACLASILEIDLADVPQFDERWCHVLRQFLAPRGFEPDFLHLVDDLADPWTDYVIVAQVMPDHTLHSSVWRHGQLVHDPSPRPLSKPSYPIVLCTILRPQ